MPQSVPDFEMMLSETLEKFQRSCDFWRQRHLARIEEMAKSGNEPAVERLKADLNRLDFQWSLEKTKITNDWAVWKTQVLKKESDKDFLRGIGCEFEMAMGSYVHAAALEDVAIERPVIGYVEIHQSHNEGPQRVQSEFTTFQDLLDESRPMSWWRRHITCRKASPGCWLYAILLGGVLKVIDYNLDSSG